MVNVTFWFSPSFEEEQDNRVFHESTWTQNKWAWWEIATSLNSLNTRKMQTTRYKSMAFSLEEMGACSLDVNSQFRNVDWLLLETNLTLLKMLMRTRKSVTRSPILANISKLKKKERERERYIPAGNNLRLDEKTDPGGDDEHKWGQINLDQELHLLPLQSDLDPTGSVGSWVTTLFKFTKLPSSWQRPDWLTEYHQPAV